MDLYAVRGNVWGTSTMMMLLDHECRIGCRTAERNVLFGYGDFVSGQEWEKRYVGTIKGSEGRYKSRKTAQTPRF